MDAEGGSQGNEAEGSLFRTKVLLDAKKCGVNTGKERTCVGVGPVNTGGGAETWTADARSGVWSPGM